MKIPRSAIGWVTILVAMLPVGCGSKELTRPQALELIRNSPRAAGTVSVEIYTGSMADDPVFGNFRPDMYLAFAAAGLLEAKKGPRVMVLGWTTLWDVALTEKGTRQFREGNRSLAPRGGSQWIATTAERREIVEVTGLTKQTEQATSADFTWRWVPNDVGEVLLKAGLNLGGSKVASGGGNPLSTSRAAFQLYDDGWRLIDIQF